MGKYREIYQQSIQNPDTFWAEKAQLIHWEKPFDSVLDYQNPPFAKWFVGGRTNICFNAVDRHLETRADQAALIAVSVETDTATTYTYQQLFEEVNRMAAIMQAHNIGQGDRVLIYMPMVAQACFAMLAALRLGAIHSVVFGGFAAHSLAARIEDAKPKLIVASEAGMRNGKVVPYKPLLDEALQLSSFQPNKVLLVSRRLCPFEYVVERDLDYSAERANYLDARVPCTWVEATDPSYILYTSGTTGKPKGVQRDTGGYAVALAASMDSIFCANPGETMFCTSDIGWVVGHSYIIYGPLIHGMATIMFEGTPLKPDAGIWWKLVEKYRVTTMFSAPTAIRVLKKQDAGFLEKYDISSLRTLFLAGEPLDEPTAQWISGAIQKPIIDNYWQTETGWPILALQQGIEKMPNKFGSPGVPVYGYQMQLIDEVSGAKLGANQKGLLAIEGPLPPGCMQTIWGDDERFVQTYWKTIPNRLIYSTFDWGIQDEDGYFFILGRTDDVINTAGHRLGTREIEESIASHMNVAEVAVVGVADALKGQVAIAFIVARDPLNIEGLASQVMQTVDRQLGAVARPAKVYVVHILPKTRSGKIVRRALQAIAENRDPGDISTMEDKTVLAQIQAIISEAG